MPTGQEFLDAAAQRLASAKFAVERIELRGAPAVIARRKPFRVQWVLTQLKTTVIVAHVQAATAQGWQAFASDAFDVAKQIRGGLPTGFQAGIGAVPILVADTVDQGAAVAAAQRPQKEWFSGIAMPALVDLSTGAVHQYEGKILVGAIYAPFLRKQRALVTDVVRQGAPHATG